MWGERAEEEGKKGKKREGEGKKEGGEERFLFLDSDRRTVENNVPRITRARDCDKYLRIFRER
jgi:hypothetical protein